MKIASTFIVIYGCAWLLSWFRESPDTTVETRPYHPPTIHLTAPATKADSIIFYAQQYVGTPYRYGSTDPEKGFDCSGFVYHVLQSFGLNVPRSSYEYQKVGEKVGRNEWKKGDVILFLGSSDRSKVGHVGIIVSEPDQPLQFIHSSSSKKHWGVVVTDFEQNATYQERFVEIRRIF
jgi:cell wall-associated NlpC family hydrolase